MKKNIRGLTLLEIMLVLVLIAIITLMAFRTYRKTQFEQNIITLKGSVTLLQESLNRYFIANCGKIARDRSEQGISIENDLAPAFLENIQLIRNPFYLRAGPSFYSFHPSVRWSDEERNWILRVKVSFPEFMLPNQLGVIAGKTRPSTVIQDDEKALVWHSTPDADSLSADVGNLPLSDDLEQFSRDRYASSPLSLSNSASDPQGLPYPCFMLDRRYLQQFDKFDHL